jgi:V8-like Glu-specific endopeptidase
MAVNKLHYWGERDRPMTLQEQIGATPVLGSGELPEELRDLAAQRYLYLTSPQRPEPDITEVDSPGDERTWRVAIGSGARSGHRYGMSARLEDPETIHAAVSPDVDFTGKRPDWSHQLYQPRLIPRAAAPSLRRFNGRKVRPLYIFGPDDRQVFQDASYPWHCCGKLYNSDGFMGSAAVVSGNTIVTAGHMVPWNSINAGSWWMRFVPDYFDGQSLIGSGVESYISDINGYSSSWENDNYWTVVGYPGDVAAGERPSWQGSISIHDDDGDSNGGQELESQTADLNHGDSGGPIFGWWSGDPRVIGVVSGEEEEYQFPFSTEQNNVFSSGSGFTNLIAWARSNW